MSQGFCLPFPLAATPRNTNPTANRPANSAPTPCLSSPQSSPPTSFYLPEPRFSRERARDQPEPSLTPTNSNSSNNNSNISTTPTSSNKSRQIMLASSSTETLPFRQSLRLRTLSTGKVMVMVSHRIQLTARFLYVIPHPADTVARI